MVLQDSTTPQTDYFRLAESMVRLEYAVKHGQDTWLRRLAAAYAAQAEKIQQSSGGAR